MRVYIGNVANTEDLYENMMKAWLSFAHNSNPNHSAIPHWPTYDKESRATLLFGKELKIANALFDKERNAWDNIMEI
jgi:para-nitrobenzyl esterase